jgi:hypothetical protein
MNEALERLSDGEWVFTLYLTPFTPYTFYNRTSLSMSCFMSVFNVHETYIMLQIGFMILFELKLS